MADTQKTPNILAFMKSVVKYFMDFLETDFHKRRNPKRNIQFRNNSNLLIGVNLNKYESFNKLIWKKINNGFEVNTTIAISKGIYQTNIPQNLINLVGVQTNKINANQIENIINDISVEVENASVLFKKEYDQALSTSIDSASKIILKELVLPFVNNLVKPLENIGLGDENDIFQMEEELTSVLCAQLENKISEILKLLLAEMKVNIGEELKSVIRIDEIKTNIVQFFEEFKVGDLFSEVTEMERNRTILDKQEFYLYFCDITFEKIKYPIFYIPFSLIKKENILNVNFDSQLYINKKALEYIVQQYNELKGTKGTLQTINERIIYLAQHDNDLGELLNKILKEITNFFDLDNEINLSNDRYHVSKSFLVRCSNSLYISIFDKSDEALVNDYEEILKIISSGNSVLTDSFNKLIQDFIYNDPEGFNLTIENVWDEEPTPNKLIADSPIPLNSEQRQILAAIKKDGCNYITVEGPPGTGKSHTITAIVFDSIKNGKSVLVLSDKKEALDVVEDKITDTLNKVRNDINFQNPILRLGKTGNTYSQILATNTIENIKNHFRAVKSNHKDIQLEIEKFTNGLREDLHAEILASEEISLMEILEFIKLECFYFENGFPLEVDSSFENDDTNSRLEKVRTVLKTLADKFKNSEFDYPLPQKPSKQLIENTKTLNENVSKILILLNDDADWSEIKRCALEIYEKKIEFKLTKDKWDEITEVDKSINKDFISYSFLEIDRPKNFTEITSALKAVDWLRVAIDTLVNNYSSQDLKDVSSQIFLSDFNYKEIRNFITGYENLRWPIFGYLFSGKKLKLLNQKFNEVFNAIGFIHPEKQLRKLQTLNMISNKVAELKTNIPLSLKHIDLLKTICSLLKDGEKFSDLSSFLKALEKYEGLISEFVRNKTFEIFEPNSYADLKNIFFAHACVNEFVKYGEIKNSESFGIGDFKNFFNKNLISDLKEKTSNFLFYLEGVLESFDDLHEVINIVNHFPPLSKKVEVGKSLKALVENELLKINDSDYAKFIRYITLRNKIKSDFKNIPELNFGNDIKNIEELVTLQMTYLLDDRLINFYENNKNVAKTLRDIIKSKKKFPRQDFEKLKHAFPCILAGIRDYAEYIPLEPEIFDLVIIDEASQVSVSQAFPALLRAKKVLVLGDRKQFSNVKSAQARSDTNREYLNNLKDSFIESISDDGTKLVKLDKFNIKTSILEFFEFISNYQIQLLKHFRGYKEIISYSNKHFYQNNLQVMKIRGKAIDEVLKFTVLKNNIVEDALPKTNLGEVDFIISELKKIKESGQQVSVGIITPHTNQQKLLVDRISKLDEESYYYETLKLKIMTFDTCQGEERDIVFYSMVANETEDRLWGVFIKDLQSVDIEEDGKIKAQRLNVGFSRAKETMHFVLSKEIDKYAGSIGEALRHYSLVLDEVRKEKTSKDTDQNSKMESKVLDWFYKTEFWQKNKNVVEVRPQFQLGKYLKQLRKDYDHPNYKVDFLILFTDDSKKEHKFIIEYDGFDEHFTNLDEVNTLNYENYYTDEHIYREKVLESYGYKFLRINRFNVGQNPVETLDKRIKLITRNNLNLNHRLNNIKQTVENLENGQMKQCPKCKKVKEIKEFKDPILPTGYGRICRSCKNIYFARRY